MGRLSDHFLGDTPAQFDGATYEPEHDFKRLSGQLAKVREVMSDGEWHTLKYIAYMADGSEAGVSARLRDLRKHRNGARIIERRRQSDGLFEYRMK